MKKAYSATLPPSIPPLARGKRGYDHQRKTGFTDYEVASGEYKSKSMSSCKVFQLLCLRLLCNVRVNRSISVQNAKLQRLYFVGCMGNRQKYP